MKITATSEFHRTLSTTFTGCKEGVNVRRLRGPRLRYCLDYSTPNSHVCGCGYPVSRTSWDAGGKWGVENVAECGADGDCYGKGYIRFDIYDAAARAEAEREYRAEAEREYRAEAEREYRKACVASMLANLNADGTFKG